MAWRISNFNALATSRRYQPVEAAGLRGRSGAGNIQTLADANRHLVFVTEHTIIRPISRR